MNWKICKRESLFLFCITFFITAIPIVRLDTLNVSDELGTMANAAFLANQSWTDFIAAYFLAYYKYGISLFFFPIYLFTDSPQIIYQFALLVSAVMVSVIPVIVYKIYLLLMEGEKKEEIKGVEVALIIGVLPTTLLWSKSAWAETLLMLCVWLQLFVFSKLLVCSSERKRLLLGMVLVFIAILGYSAHQRGIALLLSTFALILYIKLFQKRWIVNPLIFFLVLFLLLKLDNSLAMYFKNHIWDVAITEDVNNSLSHALSQARFDIMFSYQGVRTLLQLICGWLMAMITSTYGIGMVGIIICLIVIVKCILKKSYGTNTELFEAICVYSFIYFFCTFFIGIMFFYPAAVGVFCEGVTERLDKMIYGRYVSSAIGPLVLIAFMGKAFLTPDLWKRCEKCTLLTVISIVSIFLLLVVDFLQSGTVAINQVIPLPLFTRMSVTGLEKYEAFQNNLVFACVMTLQILFLLGYLMRKKQKLIIALLFVLFTGQYVWGIVTHFIPVNEYNKAAIEYSETILEALQEDKEKFVIITKIPRTAYAYQFAYPNFKVINTKNEEQEINAVIIDDEIRRNEYNGEYYTIVGEKQIVIKGKVLKRILEQSGFQLERLEYEKKQEDNKRS